MDKKLLDVINDQMNFEIISANIYLAMAGVADDMGLKGMSHWFRSQYAEELVHGLKFFDFILDRDATPKLTAHDAPDYSWNTPIEMFEAALAHEKEVTRRIWNILDVATEVKDHAAASFIKWYVDEQVEEEATVNEIIDKLKLAEGAGIFMIDANLAGRPMTNPMDPAGQAGA